MSLVHPRSVQPLLRATLPGCLALVLVAAPRLAEAGPAAIPAVGVFRNLDQNLCLDMGGYNGNAGDGMGLYACDQFADQAWGFDREGHIINGAKFLCLTPVSSAATNGNTTLAPCNGESHQLWTISPRGGGFEIRNRKTNRCLDVDGPVGTSGKKVQLWDCDADIHNDQLWRFDTTSLEARNTVAKISAANQEANFRLLASADPNVSFTADGLVTALAQAVVVPPIFARTATMAITGGYDLTAGLASNVSPAFFAGRGQTLYTVTGPAGANRIKQWTMSGDFGAGAPLVGDLGCWDRDLDGINDPEEDKNGDNRFDSADCGGASKCWTGDVAGQTRGSVVDGVQDFHDCELACWDANRDRKFDRTTERALLTSAAAADHDRAYDAWLTSKDQYSNAGVECAGAAYDCTPVPRTLPNGAVITAPNLAKCNALPTWSGPDGNQTLKQTCQHVKVGATSYVDRCTCMPSSFPAAPRPRNECKAGRGSLSAADLGPLPAPAPAPSGFSSYRKVFGDAGAMYAVDNVGNLWSFRGAAAGVGAGAAVTGFAPPTRIDGGWASFPSVFGGVGGVIYVVDASKQLSISTYDTAGNRFVRRQQVIAGGLASTTAFGGADGTIYVQSGTDLVVYMDARRDGTALPAPTTWGRGDVAPTVVAGGVVVSQGGGTVRATKLSADPAVQVPAPPVIDGQVCIPRTAICLKARAGGALTGSGSYYTASGEISLVTDAGTWELGSANLAVNLSPTRPSVSGSAKIGLPSIGILKDVVTTTTKADATIAMGFGGTFTATIGAGANTVATSPDKFYVHVDVNGDLSVSVLGGAPVSLLGFVPIAGVDHGKLLFEPTTPIFYADGMVAYGILGILSQGTLSWWQEPVLGFSLGPCIPYRLAQPLPTARITSGADGVKVEHDAAGSTRTIDTCNNVVVAGSGTIDGGDIAVTVSGTLNLDLDLDGDGALVLSAGEDRNDWAFSADTRMDVSVFSLPAQRGNQATIYYQGVVSAQTDPTECVGCTGSVGGTRAADPKKELTQGRLRIAYVQGGDAPFAGTPLAGLSVNAAGQTAKIDLLIGQVGRPAPAGSTPEYVRLGYQTFSILGWTGASLDVTLSRIGATFTGTLQPWFGLQQLSLTGTANWDGSAATCGSYTATRPACALATSALTLAGYTLASGRVKTDFQSVMFDGNLSLGPITANVSGTANPSNNTYSVTGSAGVNGRWSGSAAGATGIVDVAGNASLTVNNGGGSFLVGASASISGCWPDSSNCITRSQSLGNLAIDSSGRITIENPFDTSKDITIQLVP